MYMYMYTNRKQQCTCNVSVAVSCNFSLLIWDAAAVGMHICMPSVYKRAMSSVCACIEDRRHGWQTDVGAHRGAPDVLDREDMDRELLRGMPARSRKRFCGTWIVRLKALDRARAVLI